jgi:hypothetical protein
VDAEPGKRGREVPDDLVERSAGDADARVRGIHVASGVELRAAERGGDEGAEMAHLADHVDAPEVMGECSVAEDPGVEVLDGGGDGGLAADLVVDGSHAVRDARRSASFRLTGRLLFKRGSGADMVTGVAATAEAGARAGRSPRR